MTNNKRCSWQHCSVQAIYYFYGFGHAWALFLQRFNVYNQLLNYGKFSVTPPTVCLKHLLHFSL